MLFHSASPALNSTHVSPCPWSHTRPGAPAADRTPALLPLLPLHVEARPFSGSLLSTPVSSHRGPHGLGDSLQTQQAQTLGSQEGHCASRLGVTNRKACPYQDFPPMSGCDRFGGSEPMTILSLSLFKFQESKLSSCKDTHGCQKAMCFPLLGLSTTLFRMNFSKAE